MTPDELHAAIMAIPVDGTELPYSELAADWYRAGHRDARHAAAELVTEHLPAEPDASPAITLDWLRLVIPEYHHKDGLRLGSLTSADGIHRLHWNAHEDVAEWRWYLWLNDTQLPPETTQGKVREIAACLGVGLKEGQS